MDDPNRVPPGESYERGLGVILILLAILASGFGVVWPVTRAVRGQGYLIFRHVVAFIPFLCFGGLAFLILGSRTVHALSRFNKPTASSIAAIILFVLLSFLFSYFPDLLIGLLAR